MKNLNFLTLSFVIALSMIGCSKDEEILTASTSLSEIPGNTAQSTGNARYYGYWVYVMDVRFSRETCATGPGVCFKNEFGDIWDYSFIDNSTDDEVGPIGVQLAGDKLHLAFFRGLEEDSLIITEDIKISENLSRALGRTIILKAGAYAVSYDTYKYGEAYVDISSGSGR